jgi:hypothetical protein
MVCASVCCVRAWVPTPDKSGEDYTKISFKPDFAKFKMEGLDDDMIGLMTRRVYERRGGFMRKHLSFVVVTVSSVRNGVSAECGLIDV